MSADGSVEFVPGVPERVLLPCVQLTVAVEHTVVVRRPVDVEAMLATVGHEGVACANMEPVGTVVVRHAEGGRLGVGASANPGGSLDQGDLEATFHEHPGCRQSSGPCADHDHVGIGWNLGAYKARSDQRRAETGKERATADVGQARTAHGSSLRRQGSVHRGSCLCWWKQRRHRRFQEHPNDGPDTSTGCRVTVNSIAAGSNRSTGVDIVLRSPEGVYRIPHEVNPGLTTAGPGGSVRRGTTTRKRHRRTGPGPLKEFLFRHTPAGPPDS